MSQPERTRKAIGCEGEEREHRDEAWAWLQPFHVCKMDLMEEEGRVEKADGGQKRGGRRAKKSPVPEPGHAAPSGARRGPPRRVSPCKNSEACARAGAGETVRGSWRPTGRRPPTQMSRQSRSVMSATARSGRNASPAATPREAIEKRPAPHRHVPSRHGHDGDVARHSLTRKPQQEDRCDESSEIARESHREGRGERKEEREPRDREPAPGNRSVSTPAQTNHRRAAMGAQRIRSRPSCRGSVRTRRGHLSGEDRDGRRFLPKEDKQREQRPPRTGTERFSRMNRTAVRGSGTSRHVKRLAAERRNRVPTRLQVRNRGRNPRSGARRWAILIARRHGGNADDRRGSRRTSVHNERKKRRGNAHAAPKQGWCQ